MATSELTRTAQKVSDLARPRASVAVVAGVVLIGELIALTLTLGASSLGDGQADSIIVTIAVIGAAAAAIGQVARSAGHATEPGHRWLLAAWVVVAALAADAMGHLPLTLTANPVGTPDIDRALWHVLLWTLALAVGVLGADEWPEARIVPYVVLGAIGAAGLVGGAFVTDGAFLGPEGTEPSFVLLTAAVLAVAAVAVVRWLFRWHVRGGWSLTWSGTGLVLGTVAVVLQLAAPYGNDRIWAASTGLLVSSLIVPGLGALAAGTAIAGAHTLARRQLRDDLSESAVEGGGLPLLDALDVELAPVANAQTLAPIGSLAHAVLPGTGLGADWWRSQAATLGLAGKLEAALATKALRAVERSDDANWVIVPIAADAVGPELISTLTETRTGTLVVVLRGSDRAMLRGIPMLRAAGVTCGIWISNLDVRLLEALDGAEVSLLVLDRGLVAGIATDAMRRSVVEGVMRHADDRSIAVLAEGVDDRGDLEVAAELGLRYVSGEVARRVDVTARPDATPQPDAAVLGLIEAAGLRESPEPDQT